MNSTLDMRTLQHADRTFPFLDELVAAPSVIGHERHVLDILAREARPAGRTVAQMPFPSGPIDDPPANITPPLLDLAAAHADAHGAEPVGFHGADQIVETQSIADAAKTLAHFIFQRFSTPLGVA